MYIEYFLNNKKIQPSNNAFVGVIHILTSIPEALPSHLYIYSEQWTAQRVKQQRTLAHFKKWISQ